MEQHPTLARLEKEVRLLKRYALGITIVVVVLLVGAFRAEERTRFGEIDVERINVVEADGRLALVISNRERLPGGIYEGEEIIDHREGIAGMLFYNARGDEVGGLTYRGEQVDSSYHAFGHFSLDQFKQDQVVAMQYLDDGTSRQAGINVWDRPTDLTIKDLVEVMLAARDSAGPARDAARQRLRELRGRAEVHRVFLGSADRTAAVRLRDTVGRERIRMYVDSADVARLEFLDEQGKVVLRLPE